MNHIEKVLKRIGGVIETSVDFATESATIQYDETSFEPNNAMNAVRDIGYELVMNENKYRTITAKVEGTSCATCAYSIDTTLSKLDGIIDSHVNLATEKVMIHYDDHVIRFRDIASYSSNRLQNLSGRNKR